MPPESPADAVPEGLPGRLDRRRWGVLVLAFGSGFAVLAIEIAGARLIAPVFGLSAVPWTAVIGVILAALAVGNHVGGRLADAGKVPLASILAAAGISGALPVLGASLPWALREALGFIPGAVASALILFAPPVLCLGAVVPYLVQADTESLGSVGRRAGDVSAAATAGSIAGTFLTGFVLLPALPLPLLLALTSVGLLVMAGVSGRILRSGPARSELVLAALLIGALGSLVARPTPGTLHDEQTLYAAVRVVEREWSDGRMVRELFQNGGSSSAEYADTGESAHAYVPVSLELLEPVMGGVRSALVLGGGAMTLPVGIRKRRPGVWVSVVEIDPTVTELAARYFAYGAGDYSDMDVVHEDARTYLRRSGRSFDLVYLDVFDHLLTVPWTLVTEEALADIADRLEPGGLFMANVLSPLEGSGVAFLERFRATLGRVFRFERVYAADSSLDPQVTQNLIVIAGVAGSTPPLTSRSEIDVGPAGRPFTDAWAPVEYLQAKVLFGGLGWS